MYKLVSVDSLAVYCDEPLPPSPPPTATSSQSPSDAETPISPRSATASPPPAIGSATGARAHHPVADDNAKKRGGMVYSSFLEAGLSDEDLEGMFRASLAGEGDRHSYVVIPLSPSIRLRVQKDGNGEGGGASGGSSGGGGGGSGGPRCKVEAFLNEVRATSGALMKSCKNIYGERSAHRKKKISFWGSVFYRFFFLCVCCVFV